MATSKHELRNTTVRGKHTSAVLQHCIKCYRDGMAYWGVFFRCICVLYDTFLHSDSAPWCIRYDSMPCVLNVSWWKHSEALVILQHVVIEEAS